MCSSDGSFPACKVISLPPSALDSGFLLPKVLVFRTCDRYNTLPNPKCFGLESPVVVIDARLIFRPSPLLGLRTHCTAACT